MNKSILLAGAFFLFVTTSNLFSQYYSDQEQIINPSWSFYSENFTGSIMPGMGNAGVANLGDVSMTMINPASLELKKKFQAQFSYSYKTKQTLKQPITADQYLMPTIFAFSGGFAYRVNEHFQFGFLYNNPQGFKYEYSNFFSTSTAFNKMTVQSFSLPLVITTDKFRAGLRLNYTMYRNTFRDPLIPSNGNITGKLNLFNAQFGVIYTPLKRLSIGLTYLPQVKGEVNYVYPAPLSPMVTKAAFAQEFAGGISYMFKGDFLKMLIDFRLTKTSILAALKDKKQIHFGLEYYYNKKWTIRGGMFNIPEFRDFDTPYYGGLQQSYDQLFLTAGATYKVKDFDVNLNIMDSHISGGIIKNMIVNAGFVYNVDKLPFMKR